MALNTIPKNCTETLESGLAGKDALQDFSSDEKTAVEKDSKANDFKGEKPSITYQNKDVLSKFFTENLKNKSFSVYGLSLPKITEILPTNLPVVEANELRLDNMLRLADQSVALVDYESIYNPRDKIKYLNYVVRALKRSGNALPKHVRMIVIYTGDISAKQTQPELNVGCLKFTVEEVFLSSLDAAAIEATLTGKINGGGMLTDEEKMQLIILPLVYKGTEAKRECIRRCFELVKSIECSETQHFVVSGMLVFTDKVIDKKDSDYMRRWLSMTKVERIIVDEINEKVSQARDEEEKKMAEALQKAEQEKEEAIQEVQDKNAEIMLKAFEKLISKLLSIGVPENEVLSMLPDLIKEKAIS